MNLLVVNPHFRTGMRLLLVLAMLATGRASFATVEGGSSAEWRSRTQNATSQLTTALDLARTNPSAAKPTLSNAVSELSTVIDAAPCSERDLAKLYFNRGLALAALGDHAAALLDFRRSDAFSPSAAALQQAETMRHRVRQQSNPATPPATSSATDAPPSQSLAAQTWRLVRLLPASIRWWGGLAALTGFWAVLGVRLMGPARLRTGATTALSAPLLGVGIMGVGTILAQHTQDSHHREVVVLANRCTPYSGPDSVAYAAASFEGRPFVPRGQELRVIEQRDLADAPGWSAWLRVTTIDRDDASVNDGVWIAARDVGWVRPESHESDK